MAAKSKVHAIYPTRIVRLKALHLFKRLVIPTFIVGVVLYWVGVPAIKLMEERALSRTLKTQFNKMLEHNKEAKNEIKRLKSNAYIEQRARKDLGLVKANEIQYYVLTKKAKVVAKPKKKPKSWWQKTVEFVEDIFDK